MSPHWDALAVTTIFRVQSHDVKKRRQQHHVTESQSRFRFKLIETRIHGTEASKRLTSTSFLLPHVLYCTSPSSSVAKQLSSSPRVGIFATFLMELEAYPSHSTVTQKLCIFMPGDAAMPTISSVLPWQNRHDAVDVIRTLVPGLPLTNVRFYKSRRVTPCAECPAIVRCFLNSTP